MTSCRSRIFAACGALVVSAAGCLSLGPDYERPAVDMPADWHSELDSRLEAQPVTVAQWWNALSDPVLTRLIERAEANNLDLKIATARLREVRAARGIIAADRLPSIGAAANYIVEQSPEVETGIGSPLSGGVSTGPGAGISLDRRQDFFSAGFDAAWELDFFGRVARAVEAADASIQAESARLRNVFVTLSSEVALNYIDYRTAQARLDIARRNIEAQAELVRLTRARYDAGLNSELDPLRAEAQLATFESQVPILATQRDLALHRLSVLLDMNPAELESVLAEPAPLPTPPESVPVGLPSTLLQRRPDIQVAERELAAATARIGAAEAERFPRFTLTGSFGTQTIGLGSGFLDSANRVWSIGPGISVPIFEGGRIRANIEVQNARQEQALYVYEQTILLALEEVENALVSFTREQARRASLAEALQANQRSVRLANERYTRGIEDFLSVLTAQAQSFESEDRLLESQAISLLNLVALYKALGGGWE